MKSAIFARYFEEMPYQIGVSLTGKPTNNLSTYSFPTIHSPVESSTRKLLHPLDLFLS